MRYDEWTRLLADGTLELRDPNSGLGADPDTKPRHQYRVEHWLLLRRVLPPADGTAPWWEPVLDLPRRGPILEYWQEHSEAISLIEYARQARYAAGHVVAYTPNGREVRREGDHLVVQPHDDNYWIQCDDLQAAQRAYYTRDPEARDG